MIVSEYKKSSNTRKDFCKTYSRPAPDIETEVIRFLLARISNKDWGTDTRSKTNRNRPVPHTNTTKRIIATLNGDPLSSGRRSFCKTITHKNIWDHQVGDLTLCFTGNGDGRATESLAMVDVDCKKRPNLQQARQFLTDYQKQRPGLSGLFIEPSTSGGGAHGYFVLVKTPGQDASSANTCLNMLERDLNKFLAEGKTHSLYTDVDMIEIKGHCPEVEWKDGKCVGLKCGILAKLPTTALDRPKEFMDLVRVPQEYCRRLHNLPSKFLKAVPMLPVKIRNRYNPATGQKLGSTSRSPVPMSTIRDIGGTLSDIARKYLAGEILTTKDRHIVIETDAAIWLAIGGWITSKQDGDKAMSSRRIGAIWTTLYNERLVTRAYHPGRCAAIRNFLSDKGIIDWYEDRYWVSDSPSKFGGSPQKGKCCQYSLSAEVMLEIGFEVGRPEEDTQRESTVDTSLPSVEYKEILTQIIPLRPPQPLRGAGIRPIRMGWASEFYGREAA